MKYRENRIVRLLPCVLIFIGILLSISFLWFPSNVIVHYEWGRSILDSYFYTVFILPLVVGALLCFMTKRYYGIFFISITGLLIMLGIYWAHLNLGEGGVTDIYIGYGYYMMLSGFIISGLAALLMAKERGLRLFKREKLDVFLYNVLIFLIFAGSALFTTYIRGTPTDSAMIYISSSLIILPLIPVGVLLIINMKNRISDLFVDLSISLVVWGICSLLFSIVFLSVGACSCGGCITSFSFTLLLFTVISLWLGTSGLFSWFIITYKEKNE